MTKLEKHITNETENTIKIDDLMKYARDTNNSRIIEVIAAAIYHATNKKNIIKLNNSLNEFVQNEGWEES